MPLEFHYTESKGVLVTGTGEVTGEELIRTNAQIYETPAEVGALAFQLWDLTQATSVAMTRDVTDVLASQDRRAARRHPKMVIAIAVKSDVGFGFSRVWEADVDPAGFETRVCRTVEEARSWIEATIEVRPTLESRQR